MRTFNEHNKQQWAKKIFTSDFFVFCLLWVVTFILYYPAAKSGKAGTYHREWLIPITQKSFIDYINFSGYSKSLYQFTQFTTYVIYKLLGTGLFTWHCIQLTMHIFNCLLLYIIFKSLLGDCKIRYSKAICFCFVLLFAISSYNSEVIVHEPCFHYLLGFFLMLLTLRCAQLFFKTRKKIYALWGALLFLPATYSIEIFFLTPLFILSFAVFYISILKHDKALLKKTFMLFTLPQGVMILINLAILYFVSGNIVAHGLQQQTQGIFYSFLTKTPKYLFHIFILGRYYPHDTKMAIYHYFDSTAGIISFWAPILLSLVLLFIFRKKIKPKGSIALLSATLFFLSAALVAPLEFPDALLVLFDRYTYVMMPFFYLLIVLLFSAIPYKIISIAGYSYYVIINAQYTIEVVNDWDKSTKLLYGLIKSFPDPKDKIVLILNSPENYKGIMMIGSIPVSNFKIIYNFETGKKLTNKMYEVESYNMASDTDGARTLVVYDSVMHVELKTWGDWWWYHGDGGLSYENKDFRVKMIDMGRWYELTLKHPASDYLLLYQVGDKWKIVDWSNRSFQY